jgi:acyl-CoA dehydrogenase
MFWLLLFLVAALALAFTGASLTTTTVVFGIAILFYGAFGHWPLLCAALAVVWVVLLVPLNIEALRQEWFTRPLLNRFRQRFRPAPFQVLPRSRDAGWESQLLQPRLDWEQLRSLPTTALSDEEQSFIDGPVETFCRLCHQWRSGDNPGALSDEAWTFLRRYRLLALRLPQSFGGAGFSAAALGAVLAKIASSPGGIGAAAVVAEANAPGLVDWLLREGSDTQKLHWLPQIASGEAVACVAPADFRAALQNGLGDCARGTVTEHTWNGERALGIRLDLNYSDVALAPVADLIGICFELHDPQQRLGRQLNPGWCCALLPTDTKGLDIGRRHQLPDTALVSGPVRAQGLFIPLDWLIGGAPAVGQGGQDQGRRLLADNLAAGREMALAAACIGDATFTALAAAAWVRLQRRNGRPLSDHESVREQLALCAAKIYAGDALRRAASAALDRGERSTAAAGLVAAQAASLDHNVIRSAMDLLGGAATLDGPSNWLAHRWRTAPFASGASGANLLAGLSFALLECLRHGPTSLAAAIAAAHDDNPAQALEDFDGLIWQHIGRVLGAAARSWVLGLTGALGAAVPAGAARRHRQRASRYAAALTLLSESALLSLGDNLEEQEGLIAQLGTAFGLLYRVAALLRKWDDDDRPADDWAIVDWACLDAFHRIETALAEALRRLPSSTLRSLLRALTFPYGRWLRPPGPELTQITASRLCSPGSSRSRLIAICFAPRTAGGPLNTLNAALADWLAAEQLARRCEQAQRENRLPAGSLSATVDAAVSAGILNREEASQLQAALKHLAAACAVDDFDGLPIKKTERSADR